MKVYRLENEDGTGVYHSGHVNVLNAKYYNAPEHQPGVHRDGSLGTWWSNAGYERFEYRSGFATKKQLNAWFTKKEQYKLSTLGSHINTYSVPRESIKFGDKQIMFRKDLAIRIEPKVDGRSSLKGVTKMDFDSERESEATGEGMPEPKA